MAAKYKTGDFVIYKKYLSITQDVVCFGIVGQVYRNIIKVHDPLTLRLEGRVHVDDVTPWLL
jgi:hypothetical protein